MAMAWAVSDGWISYDADAGPHPADGHPVWVFDEFYSGVTIGFFDGHYFRTLATGDDCHVTHWMALEWPSPPEGASYG